MSDDRSTLRRKIALAYQILYLEGITREDTLGHVSARLPGETRSYVKPWGMGFEEVTPESLLAMDLEGNQVGGGEGRLHSEMPLHNEIYRARPDVHCVIHIHPFHATLLSSVWEGSLRIVNQNTQVFAGGIAFYESSELIRSSEKARGLAQALGLWNAVLMKNHGIVAVGPTVEQALVLAVQLEKAAHTHLTLAPFAQVREIPREVATRWAEELMRMAHCTNKFEYWCRKLRREGTGVYSG
jgi:L-fuculose-phosphate aldolase